MIRAARHRPLAAVIALALGVMAVVVIADRRGDAAPGAPAEPSATAGTPPADQTPAALPWLRRDGRFLRAEDGRSMIVHGADYAYNTIGLAEEVVIQLTDADLDRIAGWGMNTLRIRLRDYRAGLYPGRPPEPSYLEGLDDLIRRANARGLYAIIGIAGPDDLLGIKHHPEHPLFDQARFLPDNPARTQWLAYLESIFTRYRDWPGVIGFDPINEDYAYPPEVHDQLVLEAAHRDALAALRRVSPRHIYFQQPSGWVYMNQPVAVGHDLGDPNRFFCVKWQTNQGGVSPEWQSAMLNWAAAAGTPLFVCEYLIFDVPNASVEQMLALQRAALGFLDRELIGSVRLGYLPRIGSALITPEGEEKFWLQEFARPYPVWVGGVATALQYDFDARALRLQIERDGSGPTEIAVPLAYAYPGGFVASTSDGTTLVHDGSRVLRASGLDWRDTAGGRLIVPAGSGEQTIVIRPRPEGAGAAGPSLSPQRTNPADFAGSLGMGGAPPITEADVRGFAARLVRGGQYTAEHAACIVREARTQLPPSQFAKLVSQSSPGVLSPNDLEPLAQSIYACVGDQFGG